MDNLINTYSIPGVSSIAVNKIEIYLTNEGESFAKFKNGLDITCLRDSIKKTRIKALSEVYRMLSSEKKFNQKMSKKIDEGRRYIANELKRIIQQKNVGGNK